MKVKYRVKKQTNWLKTVLKFQIYGKMSLKTFDYWQAHFLWEGGKEINFILLMCILVNKFGLEENGQQTIWKILQTVMHFISYRQLLCLLFKYLRHRCQKFFLIISVSTLHKTNVPIKEKFNKIVFIALTKVKHLTIHCMKI